MDPRVFFPFVREKSVDYFLVFTALCEAYKELNTLSDEEFSAVVQTVEYKLHLDSFLNFAWRPFENLPFSETQKSLWGHLRLMVLDTLSRACHVRRRQSGRNQPLLLDLLSSVTSVLSTCAMYAYDQLPVTKNILDTVLGKSSTLKELATALIYLENHLDTMRCWIEGLDAQRCGSEVDDILSCLEDCVFMLSGAFLSAPRLCHSIMGDADHMFTHSVAHMHNLLTSFVASLGKGSKETDLYSRACVITDTCVALTCHLITEGILRSQDGELGASTSKAADEWAPYGGELLLSCLNDLQVLSEGRTDSLVSKLESFGLLDALHEKIREGILVLNNDEIAYLCAIIGSDEAQFHDSQLGQIEAQLDTTQVDTKSEQHELNHVRKSELILAVKACLPEEEDKIIEACLISMQWDVQAVVDMLVSNVSSDGKKRATRSGIHYAPGKSASFDARPGQVKDMKQKTFELLEIAEEYEDEYDDSFDALDVGMQVDVPTEIEAALDNGVNNAHRRTAVRGHNDMKENDQVAKREHVPGGRGRGRRGRGPRGRGFEGPSLRGRG